MKLFLRVCLFLFAVVATGAAQAQTKTEPLKDIVLGKDSAPVTIYEYSSMTCPHCATFHKDTLPKLKQDWIDTGKAKLVLRDFPLDPLALAASMLAHCAGPDRYYGFVDVLFQTQAQWARSDNPGQALKNIARLGGIPEDKFDACLKDEPLMTAIKARQNEAQTKYNISSTPTFVIEGDKIEGAQSYDKFADVLKKHSK